MKILLACVFFHALAVTLAFDIELEGRVNFGPDMMRRIMQDVPYTERSHDKADDQNNDDRNADGQNTDDQKNNAYNTDDQKNNGHNTDDQNNSGQQTDDQDKGDHNTDDRNTNDHDDYEEYKSSESNRKRRHIDDVASLNYKKSLFQNSLDQLASPRKSHTVHHQVNHTTFLQNLTTHLIKKGSRTLKGLGLDIKKHIDPNFNHTDIVKKCINKYKHLIKGFITEIDTKKYMNKVDREFFYFKIIDTSNAYVAHQAKLLLDDIIVESSNNNITDADIVLLTLKIKQANIKKKTEDFQYLCIETRICRAYPAYSDYVAKVLKDVLKYPDDKLDTFVNHLKTVAAKKIEFFASFMNHRVASVVSNRLEIEFANLENIRTILLKVRHQLVQKHTKYDSQGGAKNPGPKALKILIDIIDKTFDTIGDEFVKISFSSMRRSLQAWKSGQRADVNEILMDFIFGFVSACDIRWTERTKIDVSVLIELIVMGKTEESIVHDDLFTKGSKFVEGEVELYDPDILSFF